MEPRREPLGNDRVMDVRRPTRYAPSSMPITSPTIPHTAWSTKLAMAARLRKAALLAEARAVRLRAQAERLEVEAEELRS